MNIGFAGLISFTDVIVFITEADSDKSVTSIQVEGLNNNVASACGSS